MHSFSENLTFRKAVKSDAETIWEILQQAILRRKKDGSQQWQNGYPNLETVHSDIEKNQNYVLESGHRVLATAALIFNDEPAYEKIKGKWLTDSDFYVVHRVAVSDEFLGRGLIQIFFKKMEAFAKQNKVFSIKVDTNFDNPAMLRILEKLGYMYCGEVEFSGSPRKAFEKVLAR